MDIPQDFDSSWELSDVILIAEDAEGNEKELHANRAFLSIYSSFFKGMFSSIFKEATSGSVKVSCSYEILKLILQIIFGQSRDLLNVHQVHSVEMLLKMYKTADYLDMPAIMKMCVAQMVDQPSFETAIAVFTVTSSGIDLHDPLMEILQKASPDDVRSFLFLDDVQHFFSKKDVFHIYERMAKKPLPKAEQTFDSWYAPRNMPDLSENYENPLIDSTKKWNLSNLLIKTKNSGGMELFSNKTVLAIASPHFSEMFCGLKNPENSMRFSEIQVDVDYTVMKNILTIIHHSYNHGSLATFVRSSHALLYQMYSASVPDNLNIPVIRNICVKGFLESPDRFIWEMAINLNVAERMDILAKLEVKELLQWLSNSSEFASSKLLSVFNNYKYRVYYTHETQRILSLNEVRVAVMKLLNEYDK